MQIDPSVQAVLAAAPPALPTNPAELDVGSFREGYEALSRAGRKPYPDHLLVSDHVFRAHERSVAVRVYRPRADHALPGVLFLHGGGWVIGSIESHDSIAAELALASGTIIVSVGYALAPEAPYPAAIEDVEAAVTWLIGHALELGIDGNRLAICGDSAGGHLAALYSVRAALDGKSNPFSCQVLFYPVVDSGAETPSYRDNAHAPVLSAELMRWFIDTFAPKSEQASARAFPMRAARLAGQPETYIVTAGHDPLRDEALQYGCRLAAEGVPVTMRNAADLVHGFLRLRGISARAREEFERASAWLAQRLFAAENR